MKNKFACLKCGGHTVYLSVTPMDLKGTYTCHTCGQTEDARYGITVNGIKLDRFSQSRALSKEGSYE